jgi:hypothetical protein
MSESIKEAIVDWEWSGDWVSVVVSDDDPTINAVVVCNADGSTI